MNKKLNRKEFDKKILELVKQIKEKTVAFPNDNVRKQQERKKLAMEDFFYFATTYFPHYIDKPFGEFHKELHSLTENERHIVAIAGPRAHGKTVLLAIIKPIWKALQEKKKFIVFVSENETLSEERTTSIQVEFLYNKRIIHDFGAQLGTGQNATSDFTISLGTRFLALGYKQPIRGKLFGHYRPDLIIIDDFEGHGAQNPRIARNKLEYVREEAFGALPKKKGIVVWLANLTHKESAIAYFKKVVEESSPRGLIFRLYKAIEHGKPLWPAGYTIEDLLLIKETMGTVGFERHFMMNPITEGIKFKSSWFKYYTEEIVPERTVTYCDPSLGSKTSSDYKGIITIGILKNRYYLLDVWIRKATILAMLEKLYQLDMEYNTRISMESNFWQKVLWDFIPELSKKYGYILPVSGIENRQKKTERIEAITPLFEWGWIFTPKPKDEDIVVLEEQLLGFPDHPNDDGPDALAGAITLLKTIGMKQEYRPIKKRMATKFNNLI